MLFRWGCTSFHFLIHNFNSTSSPKLAYSNLFLFTTASFHLLIYNTNVIFSATLQYFNLFHFTTFYFHFLICNIKITFLLHVQIPISFTSLLLVSLHCGMLALKFELKVLLVSILVLVVLFTKQPFNGEGLDVTSFLLFLEFFSLFRF